MANCKTFIAYIRLKDKKLYKYTISSNPQHVKDNVDKMMKKFNYKDYEIEKIVSISKEDPPSLFDMRICE